MVIMREQLYFPVCHCLQIQSLISFFFLLVTTLADTLAFWFVIIFFWYWYHFFLFSLPCDNLGLGKAFSNMALKAETTEVKNKLVCVKIKYFNISKAS